MGFAWCGSSAALGLKPGSIRGMFFAALKALRHPEALRGAEAPLFHGAAGGGGSFGPRSKSREGERCGIPLLAKCARNGAPRAQLGSKSKATDRSVRPTRAVADGRLGIGGINSRFLTGLGARFGMTRIWDGVAWSASLAASWAEARFHPGTFFAALEALRHPEALRGAEAPLFHGGVGGGDPAP